MINIDKIQKMPDWSRSNINRWADYIELRCIYGGDHIVTKDDVLDFYSEEEADALKRGEIGHSLKYDDLAAVIGNYYEMMSYRSRTQEQFYPFELEDGQCLLLKKQLSQKHIHYLFLLLCSSICFMDRSSLQTMTHLFEKYCGPIMTVLVPADARTELFGTSRNDSVFKGSLRKRISQLADCVGARTTRTMEEDAKYDKINAGDAGLDIVSYLKLDETSHIPVALGQCTCSYDSWIDKQQSISYDAWRSRIDPMAPFWKFMYVPFYCRNANGRFEHPSDIRTCLIDRHRILNILKRHNGLFDKMGIDEIKKTMQTVWNS